MESIAPSEDRDKFRSLISLFRRPEDFVDIREVADFDLGARRAGEFLARTVQEWIANREPADFLADVAARLDVIDASHVSGSPEDIFRALTYIAPEYGVRVRDAVLAGGNARFYLNVAPFVQAALVREPENGVAIARRLLGTGNSDAAGAVAAALGYRVEQPNPEDEARRVALFREVFTYDDSLVRRRAAFSFGFFRFDYPATAAPTVAETPVGTDSAFAEGLYTTLHGRDVDDALVQPLIDNLREVDDLDYWATDFLRRIAPERSRAVLQFLLERIRLRTERHNYQPIPHAGVTFGPLVDALLQSQTFEMDFLEIIAEYHTLSSLEQFWFDQLYGYVAERAPEMAKRLIAGALAAEDELTRSMAVRWLHRVPHDLLTSDVSYVVRLMERGCAVNQDLSQAVYVAIVGALASGASTLAPYQPAPSDQRLMDVAAAALQLDLSICARRWFERMQARGQADAERTIRHSEETFGPQ